MKLAFVAALTALALPGPAQDAYSWFELVPPTAFGRPFPLFDRAFTSGRFLANVAVDRAGNVYVVDLSKLYKITPDGRMTPLAGFGPAAVTPGDRLPALLASPSLYASFAADSKGNLYLPDSGGIDRLAPDGTIARFASVSGPTGVDSADNVYVLAGNNRIVRISPDSVAETIAGGETGSSGDGGPATAAQFSASNMAVDPSGTIWIADLIAQTIRRIDRDGTIRAVADAPNPIVSLAADSAGNLYFVDSSATAVQRLSPDGEIRTVAGSRWSAPYRGDGGPATNAFLSGINAIAVDSAGAIYLAMYQRLSKVDPDGVLHTIAGCACGGESVPSNWGQTGAPGGLVRDSAGNTYFSDQASHVIRRITPDGVLTTVAGTGESGFSGDGGPAREARLSWPAGLAIDSAGAVYVADEQNSRIRKFLPGGAIQTVAGNGNTGFSGDGGPALSASLGLPDGVAIDTAGNLYIADSANHRVRKVTSDGVIRTIAGSDQYGTSGDGGPALQALFINPRGLAFDAAGNLLVTDSSAHMVRRITPAGIVERVAGTGQAGMAGDNGPALAAQLDLPWAIAADASGNIFFGDGRRTRQIDRAGRIQSIGYPGAVGIAVDASARVWVASTSSGVGVFFRGTAPFALPPAITNATISAATGPWYVYPAEPVSVVAPGEIVAIAGSPFNIPQRVASTPPVTTLAGIRVFFDDLPAPILAIEFDRITAIAPFGISGKSAVGISLERDGSRSNVQMAAVLPAVPSPFINTYGALAAVAAVNEDGTPNTMQYLAPRGSVVSLYVTGVGDMTPPLADGQLVTGPSFPAPVLPVTVRIGDRALDVLWAGAAPSQVAGVVQVNVRLPSDVAPTRLPFVSVSSYSLELRVGNAKSRPLTLWAAE